MPNNISPESLSSLSTLAGHIYARHIKQDKLIVPVIGAGGSANAGIPVGYELMNKIRVKFFGNEDYKKNIIEEILTCEAKKLFWNNVEKDIDDLSFFQFASLFSKFEYGKQIINEVVTKEVSNPTRKPLCYELLAHLAKHRFIDHFISVNFDELLDESLLDEIPNKLRKIIGSEDLPGPNFNAHKNSPCYLLKPFGTHEKNIYKINPEEVLQFGSDSLWKFCIDKVLSQAENGKKPEEIILILVGYAAGEQAFHRLVTELSAKTKKIYIFTINNQGMANNNLSKLEELDNLEIHYIIVDADDGINVLYKLLFRNLKMNHPGTLIVPTSRHEIISNCMSFEQASDQSIRFKTEVILQALKSRGFITIDSIGEIERIRRFADKANSNISDLCSEGVLCTNSCSFDYSERESGLFHLSTDLELNLTDTKTIGSALMNIWKAKRTADTDKKYNEKIIDLELDEGGKIVKTELPFREYLEKRLEAILLGPDIEIKGRRDATADWIFKKPVHLRSISELGRKTSEIFRNFLDHKGGHKKIYALWSSGEWLFHKDCFAYKLYGEEVLKMIEDGQIEFHAVFIKPHHYGYSKFGIGNSENVFNKLLQTNSINNNRAVNLKQINWWKHNRKLTLLRVESDQALIQKGIYFRRRMGTPLVAPIYLEGSDCDVLLEIYKKYLSKDPK